MVLKSSLYWQECFRLTISDYFSSCIITQNSGFTGETVWQSQKQKISDVTDSNCHASLLSLYECHWLHFQ